MQASESGCLDVVKELLGAMAGVDMQDEVRYLCWELKITTVVDLGDCKRWFQW